MTIRLEDELVLLLYRSYPYDPKNPPKIYPPAEAVASQILTLLRTVINQRIEYLDKCINDVKKLDAGISVLNTIVRKDEIERFKKEVLNF